MYNSKIKAVAVLYEDTCKEITANPNNWQDFLKSICHNYKLRFDEKVLVYAQKPNARAVLELVSWSRYFGRYVQRGTKGIAVFNDLQRNHSLKHYFDISDTVPTEKSRAVPIWEINSDNVDIAINYFESNYTITDEDLGIMIQTAVADEVQNFVINHSNDLFSNTDDLFKGQFMELSANSSALVIMERLGINSSQYFYDTDFEGIANLRSTEAINTIGSIVDETSKKILSDISMHLSLENRRKNYGTHIPSRRGLSNTQPISTENRDNRTFRQSQAELSAGGKTDTLHQSPDNRETERTLADSSEGSREQNGSVSRTDEKVTRSDRGTESPGYDGMGRQDEPNTGISKGDSATRTDLQLKEELSDTDVKPLLTIEEQKEIIETEVSATSVFSIPNDVINKCLQRGSGFVDGKFRIYRQFQNSFSVKENADFLKNEYGIGGTYPAHSENEVKYNLSCGGKGIEISVLDNQFEKVNLSWMDVSKKINYLIKSDKYLNPKEKELYSEWLTKEETQKSTSLNLNSPISHITEYSFNIGDKVYLDANEYEILSIDEDKVILFDAEYPLINTEMERAVFNSKVALSSSNDHLKVEVDKLSTSEVIKDVKPIEVVKENTSHKKTDYVISEITIPTGKKEKFKNNIEAIRTLKKIQEEKRLATADEQDTLAKYVGWGGLSEAFDKNNESWRNEYIQLSEILSAEEYSNASASTLSAFYTPKAVIKSIYDGLKNLGFKTGNILEPSCGTGNFIGSLPSEMKSSQLIGVEIDKISAEIAQQLYQNSTIANQPFEKTELPDNFFDVVVGNVPFGDFRVNDKKYNKNNFLIHDYFFAKSLDKLSPGGVMALVTSKGTMDKKNPSFRKYLSQRANLLGAVRLPTSTFKNDAGTEVTSDILFLQKRDSITNYKADWVYLDTDDNGITMNSYFVQHPEMVVGTMRKVSGRFGEQTECILDNSEEFENRLSSAISNIKGEVVFKNAVEDALEKTNTDEIIPAEPTVRNYSYTIIDNKLYFRENSTMVVADVNQTAEKRIRGMIEIRDCVRALIDYQLDNYPDESINQQQEKLNSLYDSFTKKYGLINSRANKSAMSDDSSYSLLSSLEVLNENNELIRKADIFTKRTIKPHTVITSVDNANDALAISIGETAQVNMEYMIQLTGKSEADIYQDLQGVIFLNPMYDENIGNEKYLTADEYLSGNVREKLTLAKKLAESSPEYQVNVMALEKVQPEDLKASEISVRLGATWIPASDVKDFIFETLETPYYLTYKINVIYVPHTGEWNITHKSADSNNVLVYNTYGTSRVGAYKIIEDTLNLRDTRVFDYTVDTEGKTKPVLNKKETTLAQSKQELLKQKFVDWIWQNPERRERLCKKYNTIYNSNRTREYDGSHIKFIGMNSEIKLRKHQVNAIARVLYGGNTLLAHCVGAGKTYEMVASAQESKRLGLCNKSMIVVPNHLTEQWASEYLQLYPSANILVATKKDFETKNRKRFCSRIATGEYDAVIIGHSQFEKIPMSIERQRYIIEQQINEVITGIEELKASNGEKYSIKAMERTKRGLENKLEKLNDQSRKDDVVTFEELGVDRLFIDESHYYKNLFLYTKMRNVGGIAQTEAQKSSDLYMKCRYLDEITGGKGVIFATGTPISNSMVELYTIQRYLQYGTLVSKGLQNFDAWASTFGETVTAIELNPEGSGYRAKTRFAKFYNLPELMSMFRDIADIQTAETLNLPVPKANYHNIAVKPSELQVKMVDKLSTRADRVRNKQVDSSTDNMLKITNDGRKLALDQRMIDADLPDFEGSKVNACTDNIYKIWLEGAEKRTTQLVFCDLSTPNKDGKFNVYDDIKNKLISKGIPEEEIQFIHSAKTEAQKKELFSKVRSGEVRILMGSTAKMGAGTNVQDKIIASHDIDCPWRPSDLEQRLGRTVRQGNSNDEVDIYRYVTEKTFDAYLYQLVEGKQRFASQIMTAKTPVRIAEDIDEASLSYAEIKMLATGNPLIKEKMDLDIQVQKLNLLKSNYLSTKFDLEDKILKLYPQEILAKETAIRGLELDTEIVKNNPKPKEGFVGMTINRQYYSNKKEAGLRLLQVIEEKKSLLKPEIIGEYRGFKMELSYDIWEKTFAIKLKNNLSHYVELGDDSYGNIQRLDNVLESLEKRITDNKEKLDNIHKQMDNAKSEVQKPFEFEEELREKTNRLNELNSILNLDDKESQEEKPYYQEVFTDEDKDKLIQNGYDNYVMKDGKYIFKLDESQKENVKSLLENNKKLCV